MKHTILFEIFYDADWHEVPTYNRQEVTITRGRQDQLQRVSPSQLSGVQINNRDGTYSPDNPSSPLYGKIGRNTRCRLTVDGDVRFVGEVEAWPVRWSRGGHDVWVPIVAHGIMYRLGMPGQKALARSALRRAVDMSDPAVHYPLENADSLGLALSATPGPPGAAGAGRFRAQVTSGGDPIYGGESGLPAAPGYTLTAVTVLTVHVRQSFLDGPADADNVNSSLEFAVSGGASTDVANIRFGWTGVLPTSVQSPLVSARITTVGGSNVTLSTTGAGTDITDGLWHELQVRVVQDGTDLDSELWIDGTLRASSTDTSLTMGVITGAADWEAIFGNSLGIVPGPSGFDVSHITVHTDDSVGQFYEAMTGHNGEQAHERIDRILTEENIPVTVVGSESSPVGPQPAETVLEVCFDATDTDLGILYEPRDSFGLAYRCRTDLYNQDPALELTYGSKEIGGPLDPSPDLDFVQNDVTVTNAATGVSSRSVQETGPLNVSEPVDDPKGVGRFPVEHKLNLETDAQTGGHAGWIRRVGTEPSPRYPLVAVDLDSLAAQGKTSLAANAVAADLGDRITVSSPPDFAQPDTIDVMVQGQTERVSLHRRLIDFNTVPYGPYDIGTYQDTDASGDVPRYDTEWSTTSGSFVTGTDISLTVATSAGPLWTTDPPGGWPILIRVAGAVLSVTGITGSSSPQTFTVSTTVANGVIKTIPSGSEVRVFRPAYYGF